MSTPTTLTLFCLVDGASTSRAFPVNISPDDSMDDLKKLIKAKKAPRFDDVAADKLTLWRVSIPASEDDDETSILIDNVTSDHKRKLSPLTRLTKVFPEELPEETIHIIVQRPPPQALKRDREEDAEPSSTTKHLRSHTLMDAICEAGLTEKAVIGDRFNLSLLDNKERVSQLRLIGQYIDKTDTFSSLSRTANELKDTNINAMDKLSAPHGTLLPVVETNELYVRETYRDLYDAILGTFENNPSYINKRIVVTGIPGIGNSAFLVYFTIRLLAESDDDNPPIIIFHTNWSTKCYAFGGRSSVTTGNIEDFKPFLSLPDTWYLADSSRDPRLDRAKTIISASPKTLFSDVPQYKDVDKT
ncbi:hypothetical protein DFQ27_009685, partial [Actinomortierella ambigua]